MSETAIYSELAADPLFDELISLFVSELPDRVDGMRSALDRDDRGNLRTLAHQLKGAAGSYGFEPISPAAAHVEKAAEAGDETTLRLLITDLAEMCALARPGRPE